MKIIFSSDWTGEGLKIHLEEYVSKQGHEVVERGLNSEGKALDYYDAAVSAATAMQEGLADFGVLICGSGMGVSLVANKFKGVYAALCESTFTAERSRAINNANILTMGSQIVGHDVAERMVDVFLSTKHGDNMPDHIIPFITQALDKVQAIEAEQLKDK